MTFFQTLATCHTVQVAADDPEDILSDSNLDVIDNVQSEQYFEISQTNSNNNNTSITSPTQSALETLQNVTTFTNIREESESTHSVQTSSQFITATSASCDHTFVNSQSGSTMGMMVCSSCGFSRVRPRPTAAHFSPLPSRIRLVRPLSTEFKRSTSTFDELPESKLTHRRTQSYAPPTTFLQQKSSF